MREEGPALSASHDAQSRVFVALGVALICAIEAFISSRYHVMSAVYIGAWAWVVVSALSAVGHRLDRRLSPVYVLIEPLTPALVLALIPFAYATLGLVDGGAPLTPMSVSAMLTPPLIALLTPWLLSRGPLQRHLMGLVGGASLGGEARRGMWWRELKWSAPLWLSWVALHHAEGTLLVVRKGSEPLHVALYVGTALITATLSALMTGAQYPLQIKGRAPRVPPALLWLLGGVGLGLLYVDQTMLIGLYESVHQWLWWGGFASLCVALQSATWPTLHLARLRSPLTRGASLLVSSALIGVSLFGVAQLELKPRLKSYVNRSAFGGKWLELHRAYVTPILGGYEQQLHDPRADHPELHFKQGLELPPPEGLARPNILLVSIDALRGDYVRPGQKNSPTPFISQLAKEGAFYTRAYAAGTRTAIGMTGVHFGRYSRETQWETWLYKRGKIYPPNSKTAKRIKKRKQKHVYTTIPKDPAGGRIAERLKRAGYRTVAAPYAGYNDFFRPGVGFDKGFDHFKDLSEVKWPKKSAKKVTKAALSALDDALEARAEGEPIFMWVHYYDPHESRRSLRRYRSLCSFMDKGVEGLVEGLKARALYDNTLIIITADHGEAFKEHGFTSHGSSVYEPQSRVPLIVSLPKTHRRPVTVRTPVSHVDIAATIAVAARADTRHLSGLNLLPSALGEPAVERPVFSELHRYRSSKKKLSADMTALWQGDWKLIINHLKGTSAHYNIKRNLLETRDYADKEPERFERMYELATTYRRRGFPLK